MLILVGFVLLLSMIIIGIYRARKREKTNDEFFFFSILKWAFAGWTLFAICAFITVIQDGNGDKNAIFFVSLFFMFGTIGSAIIEKILIGNNLRKKKIEEYNIHKKDSWE